MATEQTLACSSPGPALPESANLLSSGTTENRKGKTVNETSKRQRLGSNGTSGFEEPGFQTRSDLNHCYIGTHPSDGISTNDKLQALDPNGPETPEKFLRNLILSQFGIVIDDSSISCDAVRRISFFDVISEDDMSSYTVDVAAAARANDVEQMRKLQDAGVSLNCCNRFGESLLHIACRRGFVEMVRLILDHPGASVRLCDDCGRNPLHDLCWNPSPQLQICQWILEREPSLFFLRDKRGFTPFDYAREEHWHIWKRFVLENAHHFKKLESDCYSFLLKSDVDSIQS